MRALAFDPRSGRLVSASYDRSVRVWDLGTGRVVRVIRNCHTSHIFDVKFDARRIVRCVSPFPLYAEEGTDMVGQYVARPEDCGVGLFGRLEG